MSGSTRGKLQDLNKQPQRLMVTLLELVLPPLFTAPVNIVLPPMLVELPVKVVLPTVVEAVLVLAPAVEALRVLEPPVPAKKENGPFHDQVRVLPATPVTDRRPGSPKPPWNE
jgi:hypothetical protein